ncbi:MAG: type II 3-dehydroquinate dehydratase [Clostridia bacterium]|nr:type II 3-dehydroquinate dehydratase [Clostridia bacterium]
MKIFVLNGPNLNLLGVREPEVYGRGTYAELCEMISLYGAERDIEVEFRQTNCEGTLVDYIHEAFYDGADGIVINPAAYTHTSVAILDAVKSVALPTVEVHISDVSLREDFRQKSYIRAACVATVMGKGFGGYIEAIKILEDIIGSKS